MCDIGYLVKPHIRAIMQLLTVRLPDYGVHMITTKCLNTAVMMMYLFLGDAARIPTKHCDTNTIRARYNGRDSNLHDRATARQLLDDVIKSREHALFYVMITDSDIQQGGTLSGNSSNSVYFPGHVFVIERIPLTANQRHGRYHLYQSYINKYTLADHMDQHDALSVGHRQMKRHLENLVRMTETRTWTAETTTFWKELTNVDASHFQGHVIEGKLMLCYQKVIPEGCVEKLQELVDREVDDLSKLLVGNKQRAGDVFGGEKITDADMDAGTRPLTNAGMFKQLRALQKKLH